MTPYLIQRGKFSTEVDRKGIDSIISLDYMGSAEFEWGALPKSLKKIRDYKVQFIYLDIDVKGKNITVYCHKLKINDVELYLQELTEKGIMLKEFSGFDSYINDDKTFGNYDVDFWWDIKNDLMFWKKDLKFEEKFRNLI